jgi:KaiC/GvpD/RAD55 family RecA-like ATPase
MVSSNAVIAFYRKHLPQALMDEDSKRLMQTCPWCRGEDKGKLIVDLQPDSPFFGQFWCTSACTHGGWALEFAQKMSLDLAEVPDYDPDREPSYRPPTFPFTHKNAEMYKFARMCSAPLRQPFRQVGIQDGVLTLMNVGYNGRLYIYPYLQEDGNCYSLRGVPFAGKFDQPLWQGEETFTQPPHNLFNTPDIGRADGGTLVVTVGERNALAAKQIGCSVVAIPTYQDDTCISAERLEFIRQAVIIMNNDQEGREVAQRIGLRLGFKARIVRWETDRKKGFGLGDLLAEDPEQFDARFRAMVSESEPMSPLTSARRDYSYFVNYVESHRGRDLLGLETCFPKFNKALDGLRGLNVLGAQPKAGKSTFFMQVASSLADEKKVPVIYYDFENGRQKIYTRTLARMSRLSEREMQAAEMSPETREHYDQALKRFRKMLERFKVVTDRKINPDLMRKQISFLRNQTGAEDMLLIVDSLHKLPFGRLKERRSGIDEWLRNMEAIRDNHQVTFLVISELGRAIRGGYDEKPDLASFKETGDIEYTADNALIMTTNVSVYDQEGDTVDSASEQSREAAVSKRTVDMWLVASREMSPGKIATYRVDYPYWGFQEL